MEIDYINGPRTEKVFGVSKYQTEIFRRIEGVEWNIIEYDSFMQILEKNIIRAPNQDHTPGYWQQIHI